MAELAPLLNVAVRVQHHPSRADLLPALFEPLRPFEDVQVIADPGGRKPSSWRTHRLCLESVPDDATHLVVLQDDAILADRFHVKTLAAVERWPDRIIALFIPGFGHLTRQVNIAQRAGRDWLDLRVTSFLPLVGIIYPAEVARAIPAFADAKRIQPQRADDAVVATFARAHRLPVVAPLPCLVDHRTDVESAMGMRPKPGAPHRRAALFDA